MNFFDRVIAAVSPKTAYKRQRFTTATGFLRAYEAAQKGRRTDNWRSTGADANAENMPALEILRNRSRDLVRNDGYAKRMARVIPNNTVGTGIRPVVDELEEAAEKRLMKTWRLWAEKTVCDFDGLRTFYGIQKAVMRCVFESGECFVVRRRYKNPKMPLQLQVIEPDYIDKNKHITSLVNGGKIVQGVEFDADGRRVAYWVYEEHPGAVDRFRSFSSKRIAIEDICHIYDPERPGQVRGIPWLASVMLRLKDFNGYEDAELVRQQVASCFAVFFEDSNPDSDFGGDNNELTDEGVVESGMMYRIPQGTKMSFATPPTTQNYDGYSRRVLQGIAAGVGVTYEAMTGDLSSVNFSSGRMGWLEFQRDIYTWQFDMLIPQLCDKVWGWFAEAGEKIGIMDADTTVQWTVPRREMIDPLKEIKALQLEVLSGFKSLAEALREKGFDPDETLEEIAKYNDIMDKLGIKLESDARWGKSAPLTEPAQPE